MWKHEHSYRAPEKGFLLVTLIHAMISWHNTVLPDPPFSTSCWSRWWMFHRYVFHGYTFAHSPIIPWHNTVLPDPPFSTSFCNRWRTFHRLEKLSENIFNGEKIECENISILTKLQRKDNCFFSLLLTEPPKKGDSSVSALDSTSASWSRSRGSCMDHWIWTDC